MNRQNSAPCQYAIPSLNISPGWSIYFLTLRLQVSFYLSFYHIKCIHIYGTTLHFCLLPFCLSTGKYINISICPPSVSRSVCLLCAFYNACTLYSLCPLILMNLSVLCLLFYLLPTLICSSASVLLCMSGYMYLSLCVPVSLSLCLSPHAYEPCMSPS
jgi:hypothetical protein